MVGDETTRFPAPLLEFVRLFNAGEFWESHEVLEGPWRDGGSEFYHGLILFASAFVHVDRDNPHGIRAQLRKAERALGPYEPAHLGVDVAAVLECCRDVRRTVAEAGTRPAKAWTSLIPPPRLALEAVRLRGDEPELELPAS